VTGPRSLLHLEPALRHLQTRLSLLLRDKFYGTTHLESAWEERRCIPDERGRSRNCGYVQNRHQGVHKPLPIVPFQVRVLYQGRASKERAHFLLVGGEAALEEAKRPDLKTERKDCAVRVSGGYVDFC
jgi:hypothetical protein